MDLSLFCNPIDKREWCQRPWTAGDKTWATDTKIIVSVPADKNHKPIDGSCPDPEFIIKQSEGLKFSNMEITFPEPVQCRACGGHKKATFYPCFECEGDGWIDLDSGFNIYNVRCDGCFGLGGHYETTNTDETCRNCNGKGVVYREPAFIDDVPINPKYATLIESITGLTLAVDKKDLMVFFRGNNGVEGALMGIKNHEKAEFEV